MKLYNNEEVIGYNVFDLEGLDLSDNSWKIYTEDVATTPQFITEDAEVENSLINQGCVIAGEVKNSVIFIGNPL
mgnify:CR=1 FL=1